MPFELDYLLVLLIDILPILFVVSLHLEILLLDTSQLSQLVHQSQVLWVLSEAF